MISSPGFTTRIEVKDEENAPFEEGSEADEDLCRDNLRTVSDLVRRKLNRGSDASEPKYIISTVTEVKTYQMEEIKEQISGDLNRVRSAIKRKKVVVIQQTIITIVETVSNWLEKVEYKICTVKRVRSVNQRREELKNIKEEIEVNVKMLEGYNESDVKEEIGIKVERLKGYKDIDTEEPALPLWI